jgi:predicted nucleotidyltransferase
VVDQLEQVVQLTSDVIGGDLIGAYLHGSSVLVGLRPASDVDILAVTRRSLDHGQRRALIAASCRYPVRRWGPAQWSSRS